MITSRQNPSIKALKQLLTSSKARKDAQRFVLESPTLIKEALNRHPNLIQDIFSTSEHLSHFHDISVTEISDDIASNISSLKSPPGCFAILKRPNVDVPPTFSNALYLDGINKPSNLGAILRNAAAFNCDIIFASETTCDPYHPESIRASAGQYATTPFATSTLKKLTENTPNAQLIYCDSNAKNTPNSMTFSSPTLLILGSENGLSEDTAALQTPENSLCIPMSNNVESLNVAVTSGILLHALAQSTKSI
jgi:TrmH family RNA methyltransferase